MWRKEANNGNYSHAIQGRETRSRAMTGCRYEVSSGPITASAVSRAIGRSCMSRLRRMPSLFCCWTWLTICFLNNITRAMNDLSPGFFLFTSNALSLIFQMNMDEDGRRLLSGAYRAANQRRHNLHLNWPLSPMSNQRHAKPGTADIIRVFLSLEFRDFLGDFRLLRRSDAM